AALRTRAVRTGEGWRITGQKVWTSAARTADHGILLARTDPDAPKHRGLTYFLVDMKRARGIDIRPLKEITGESLFNEVYFDDVLLPADAVVGEVGGGWRVARNTLGNERVHMADQMTFDSGLEALIARSAGFGETVRARIGALAAEAHALACIGLRTTLHQVSRSSSTSSPSASSACPGTEHPFHHEESEEMKAYIVGVGMTKFEKPETRDWQYWDMVREAGTAALADAGVRYDQVEQAPVGYCFQASTAGQRAVYELGLTGVPVYNVNNNCATGSTALMLARQFVEGGGSDCVLAVGFEKMARGSLGGGAGGGSGGEAGAPARRGRSPPGPRRPDRPRPQHRPRRSGGGHTAAAGLRQGEAVAEQV
ncbi:acyl-CoA dehydrogenase family protein, partial [Streptomyces sp. MBT72]|uniref:thiolase family protein n=1 Tax=Streptomyces sp. MBT72 TaxID=1488402 RepID=UPI001F1A3833